MKYFLDCEFIERGAGHPIDLISIGIVAEDGRELYLVNADCDFHNASDWVWQNVLYPIGIDENFVYHTFNPGDPSVSPTLKQTYLSMATRDEIAIKILEFTFGDKDVAFWGEWCSYDWVVFCQMFGTMMQLPDGYPMRCRDVVQLLEDELKLSQDDWPKSLETDGNHNALLGAKTVKARWEWCEEKREEQRQDLIAYGYGVIR